MKKMILYGSWIFLFALCAGLAHITQATGFQRAALTIMSLIFFTPGAILLVDALKSGDGKTLKLLRWISAISLSSTLVLLLANVLSVMAPTALGDVLYEILIFVSVPMVCSQHWALSLFLWACILFATLPHKKK